MHEPQFDGYAASYEQHHARSIRFSGETTDYFAAYKVEIVAAEVPEPAGGCRILDFGGGTGNAIGHFRRLFPASRIMLADPSAKSLEAARARHPGAAELIHLTREELPLGAATCDVVFAACVFHHVPAARHVSILRELRRVLRPGGSLFVFEHNPLNPLTRKAVRGLSLRRRCRSHPRTGDVRAAQLRRISIRAATLPRLLSPSAAPAEGFRASPRLASPRRPILRPRDGMRGIRELALQGFRFGTVGIWSTGVYLLAASVATAVGLHPQLANALAYAVGTGVSFLGHFHWTFGKRSNHARALLRFLVVAGGGFLLSAGMMHVALEWLRAPVWAALASIVIVVPALSWLSGRHWAFR